MGCLKALICLVLVVTAAASAATVFAQTNGAGRGSSARHGRNDTPKISLPEAVSIAVNRNLRMADARLAIQEKEHQRVSAFSDFFPSLNLQYIATGYRYRQPGNIQGFAISHDSRRLSPVNQLIPTIDSGGKVLSSTPQMADYPYRIDPYRTFTLVATLTQPVYSGGKTLNSYRFARLGVDFTEIQFEVERQDLTLEVYEAYYQMMQSEKLLEVANQSIIALESLRNQTLEFYRAGVVPKVDVLSTEGQLATARIQRTQSLTDIERYRANLNFLLRYPQESPVSIVHDYAYRPNPYSVSNIYSIAAGNRLEIRQANISVEQALALVRASQADLIPSVNLQIQGSRTNDDWNPFDKEAINAWQIQGIFTWAFDMFRSRETVKKRRASHARAFVAREQLVEQIMNEVKRAYLDMKRSESDIFDNQKAVEFRTEAFRINRERYKEQVATYTEVLNAQRDLSLAQGDYYTSLIQYRINQAVLERVLGVIR